ncbi:tRNA (adenosine(37)-N6)-threonylcarbamoyltransferase complex ATPase subunit type 1 TsaE [Pedobacter sp.]|nr:tRNA (adenosine(37)-N6)-threonylcarbamoyltransferase complex ATPase subunit type 1 TsaE [Candidatus Saccharibacteria bacterium]
MHTSDDMVALGERLGALFRGGECLELVGDVGAGKTTLTKGIGRGLIADDAIQSPSFTISRVYAARNGLSLHHYDFYRLHEPGVMSYELAESLIDPIVVTVIEWAETVVDILPEQHVRIELSYQAIGEGRGCVAHIPDSYDYLRKAFI